MRTMGMTKVVVPLTKTSFAVLASVQGERTFLNLITGVAGELDDGRARDAAQDRLRRRMGDEGLVAGHHPGVGGAGFGDGAVRQVTSSASKALASTACWRASTLGKQADRLDVAAFPAHVRRGDDFDALFRHGLVRRTGAVLGGDDHAGLHLGGPGKGWARGATPRLTWR